MRIIIQKLHVGFLFTLFSLGLMFSTHGSQEFPITTDSHNQYHPAIYENIVVWQDDRNGNFDIYGYNLRTHEEFQITTDPDNQTSPAIHGNIVVWKDEREGNYIYGYDLTISKEFPIPEISGSEPVIYENTVICMDVGGDDAAIHGYNLSTGEEFCASLKPGSLHLYPAIYNNIIVWQENRTRDYIHAYDMLMQQEFKVSPEKRLFFPVHNQDYPAIHSDTIVWTEDFFRYIYGHNLSTGKEFLIAVTSMDKCEPSNVRTEVIGARRPAIYENIVVWVDCRNGNFDICGYNLLTGEEFFVTTSESRQQSPAIYKDMVVWEDNRNGNWDIYGAFIVPPLEMTPSTSRTRTVLLHSLVTITAPVLMVINIVLIGWSFWQVKRMRRASDMPASEGNFRKNSTRMLLFFVIGCFYVGIGVCYLFVVSPFFGPLFLALAVAWFAIFVRNVNLPYISVKDGEIVISAPMTFFSKVIEIDDIKDVSPTIPDKLQLLLSNEEVTINLSLMNEKDRSSFTEFLKKCMPSS